MKREVIYTIGARKAKSESVDFLGHLIEISGNNDKDSYTIWFGVDENGKRYMVLADPVKDQFWRNAYKSCGHWHSSGYRTYIKFWKIYKRKNFESANEANRYYMIVNKNMVNWKVGDNRKFTEAQIDILFK